MTESNTHITVELWVRSFAPTVTGTAHERAIDHLEALEERASVDSVSVRVWGRTFERSERARRVPHLERIATALENFEEWADRADRSLEPFFRTQHIESTITDDEADVCRLPTLALAEYRDEEVRHLAPSKPQESERTITATDRLEALVSGDAEPAPPEGSVLSFGEDSAASMAERGERSRLEPSQ